MLEEGCTMNRDKDLLKDTFHSKNPFSLASMIHLSITGNMAKDIKEINDLSYDRSHQGVSPFVVISMIMAAASHCHHCADHFTQTTNLVTLAEVVMSGTTPDPIPTDNHGTIQRPS
jgi:hypothetical protein